MPVFGHYPSLPLVQQCFCWFIMSENTSIYCQSKSAISNLTPTGCPRMLNLVARQTARGNKRRWIQIRTHEGNSNTSRNWSVNAIINKIIIQSHKSEGELAIDTLERISGGKRSPVMDLFRAQFRSAMECTNPVCGISNLTFDPYLSVSLSVPLPQRF